jgi:hypothetical protein
MKYDEFKRHVGKAGLTLAGFADLLNMNRASLSNYNKVGKVPDNLAVIAVLLGGMADAGLDFRSSISKVGIERKKERGAGFERADK